MKLSEQIDFDKVMYIDYKYDLSKKLNTHVFDIWLEPKMLNLELDRVYIDKKYIEEFKRFLECKEVLTNFSCRNSVIDNEILDYNYEVPIYKFELKTPENSIYSLIYEMLILHAKYRYEGSSPVEVKNLVFNQNNAAVYALNIDETGTYKNSEINYCTFVKDVKIYSDKPITQLADNTFYRINQKTVQITKPFDYNTGTYKIYRNGEPYMGSLTDIIGDEFISFIFGKFYELELEKDVAKAFVYKSNTDIVKINKAKSIERPKEKQKENFKISSLNKRLKIKDLLPLIPEYNSKGEFVPNFDKSNAEFILGSKKAAECIYSTLGELKFSGCEREAILIKEEYCRVNYSKIGLICCLIKLLVEKNEDLQHIYSDTSRRYKSSMLNKNYGVKFAYIGR